MIGRIAGVLIEKNPPQVVVDCNGVGYEIDLPLSAFYDMPACGEKIVLLTHLAIREDAHVLFGFISAEERFCFRQLIKVSGIGARTALAILSGMTPQDLALAISLQDSARLVSVPGIGKKTAERLLLELKGKLGADLKGASVAGANAGSQGDILQALLALGYSEKEALAAVKQVPADTSVSEGIRLALKTLSSR